MDDSDRDVLGVWKNTEHLFPKMATLARKILGVPASSVSCVYFQCVWTCSGEQTDLPWYRKYQCFAFTEQQQQVG